MNPIRVLVVDDNPDYRDLIRAAFEHDRRGEVVAEASDGADAILKVLDTSPDVVLLDLSMPVMDGLQALEAIKGAAPSSKILVCSAFDHTFGADAVELGADASMPKGSALGDLIDKVVNLAGSAIEKEVIPQDSEWVARYLIAVLARPSQTTEENL